MAESQVAQNEQDREALAKEVWNDEAAPAVSAEAKVEVAKEPEPTPEPAAKTESDDKQAPAEATVDPWAGVPTAIREEIEGLRLKVSGLSSVEMRLKQAETRLGGVQNELHRAKEAAKVVKEAPTSDQIKDASASQGKWDELKSDFPEWAEATESKLASERADIMKQMPDIAKLKAEHSEELAKLRLDMMGSVVSIKHPDWQKVNNSPEFQKWRAENGDVDSENPNEVIAILDNYAAFKASQKTPTEIIAERETRLAQSQVLQTSHKVKTIKSEADMTPTELRAAVAKQIWSAA